MGWYWLLMAHHSSCDAACRARMAQPDPVWPWALIAALALLMLSAQYVFVLWLAVRDWWRGRP